MAYAVASLLIVLAVLWLFVRWLEPRFAFFPSRGEASTPAHFGVEYSAVTFATSDGERIHTWLLRAAAPRALIVYFHGNGGNLSVWTLILIDIVRRGYDVLAVDYRGYGRSSGTPTESGLYRDADAVVAYAETLPTGARPLVYWGRSLGTAVAAYAATKRPPDGVIAEAGFPSARPLLRGSPVLAVLALFSTYRFPTAAFLNRSRVNTLVIHGDADRVVPFSLGEQLFARLTIEKSFLRIPGGDHNDAQPRDAASYWSAIDHFISNLRPKS